MGKAYAPERFFLPNMNIEYGSNENRAENRKDRMLPNLLQKIVNIFRTKINSRYNNKYGADEAAFKC